MDFDEKAKSYDAWYKTPFGVYADGLEKNLVFKLLGPVKGKRLLDVGCGTGHFSITFSKEGARVVAMDSSIEMLRGAKEKIHREGLDIDLMLASAENLPFKKQTFDLVTSITSLCFVANPFKAANEMKRSVKGGGKILLAVLNSWSLYALEKRVSSRFKDSFWRKARFFNIFELNGLLDNGTWGSTLFALPWMPSWMLRALSKFEGFFSKVFKPFGAFIVIAQVNS